MDTELIPPGVDPNLHVSVVVAMYNEEESLSKLFTVLADLVAQSPSGWRFEFIFVDDGSSDDTRAIVDRLCPEAWDARVVAHEVNCGFGAALRSGVEEAKGQIILSYDADCTYSVADAVSLVRAVQKGADVATANPFQATGPEDVPLWRVFLSQANCLAYRGVLWPKAREAYAYSCAFRAYRAELVKGLTWRSAGFGGASEILGLCVLAGARVVQADSQLSEREFGKSKMRVVRAAIEHARVLLRLLRSRLPGFERDDGSPPEPAVASWLEPVTRLVRMGVVSACVLEVLLRLAGLSPTVLETAGLAAIVDDKWTGWRLRPDVRDGPEWIWTNRQGMHARSDYPLARPEDGVRIAVLGSSVAYGLGVNLDDTLPMATQARLRELGMSAEVLNFGTHGYNMANVSAMVQTYVHQFQVDMVVLLLDFQLIFPQYPGVVPRADVPVVHRLTLVEGAIKRASEHSVLVAVLDNPASLRAKLQTAAGNSLILRASDLSAILFGHLADLMPRAGAEEPSGEVAHLMPVMGVEASTEAEGRSEISGEPVGAADAPSSTSESLPTAAPVRRESQELRDYRKMRVGELGATLAATAAFCNERSIKLCIITPYGPYANYTPEEFEKFSVHHFLGRQTEMHHGDEGAALRDEIELVSRVVEDIGRRYGTFVMDMLGPSLTESLRSNPDFSTDGVHFTVDGYRNVGRRLADFLVERDAFDGIYERDRGR
jgi:dolichol-phosphate mannosyltransferase